ncbi:MAG: type II toxin-antitoxin system RelE/ParE family toxin [Candidatus Binatia bacterium]
MGRYSVRILRSAAKEIEAISTKKERRAIVRRIEDLAEEPRGMGCEKLAGREDRYRVRQGRYRIVYSIEDEVLTVVVVKVGHRKDVYR